MNNSQKEQERRARLLKSRAERLPDIKKQFEEAQKRHFNSNFAKPSSNGSSKKNASKAPKNAVNGKNAKKIP